jgi:hypothetical protein
MIIMSAGDAELACQWPASDSLRLGSIHEPEQEH